MMPYTAQQSCCRVLGKNCHHAKCVSLCTEDTEDFVIALVCANKSAQTNSSRRLTTAPEDNTSSGRFTTAIEDL